MLLINDLYSGYGVGNVLQGINASINQGEILGIIGRNGMGKTTLIKTIIGLVRVNSGLIKFRGQDISELEAYKRARKGISYVPQSREVFPDMTILENLKSGELINEENDTPCYDLIYEYFPILYERRSQLAGTLSGGEQQMLVIGRALINNPFLLLLDEPSEGVQPNIVLEIGEKLVKLNKNEGLTVMMVDQNMKIIQKASQRIYVLENGNFVEHLEGEEIGDTESLRDYISI